MAQASRPQDGPQRLRQPFREEDAKRLVDVDRRRTWAPGDFLLTMRAFKSMMGAALFDLPVLVVCVGLPSRCGSDHWTRVGNRRDRLIPNPDGPGVACDWEYTRNLHISDVFPITGRWLMRRALREWPIGLQDAPAEVSETCVCWNGVDAGLQDDGQGSGTPDSGLPDSGLQRVRQCVSGPCVCGKCGTTDYRPPTTDLGLSDSGLPPPASDLGSLTSVSDSGLRTPDSGLPPSTSDVRPSVSFLIGHRGEERLPHLLMTLRSIAAQEGVRFECIVVEQDVEPRIRDRLPVWVRYVQTPPPSPEMPYCRSWAFNVAAREARGRVLICHDNDLLVPAAYAAEHIRVLDGGFDVANLKRFIFYLTQASTTRASQGKTFGDVAWSVDAVMQNAQGGGSIAISRQAYERIGGFDEEFIGWGGEDNDFWDRCQSLRVHPYGHLPLVHIWHPSQPRKQDAANPTLALFAQRRSLPMAERIARLRAAHQGLLTGPAGVRERNDEAMKRGGEEGSTSVRR